MNNTKKLSDMSGEEFLSTINKVETALNKASSKTELPHRGWLSFIEVPINPLRDYLIVKRDKKKALSDGGIILPEKEKRATTEGVVRAVGPGLRNKSGKVIPLSVKVGDRIAFGKWAGAKIKIDGEELLIMQELEVLGIVE